jgi:hypothetical protein
MASSTLNVIREAARQAATGDDKFFKKLLYFFELRVPAEVSFGGITSFTFPLVLNPESYSLEEPFTLEATPTQGGGLYIEENGIVQRMIRLRGHTGFKPRRMPRQPASLLSLKPDKKSFTRELPGLVADLVSGQRHFQYLQDAVFRTYADLKRDPATSEETFLFFHNPKDDEHWLVAPQRFALDRVAARSTLYTYSIDLLVVDRADAVDEDFSEDKGWLDQVKDVLRMVQSGFDLVSGAIRDLTALTAELTGVIKDVGKIIDSATNILTATQDFISGVTELIQVPYTLLNSVTELIDEALDIQTALVEAKDEIQDIPDTVKQMFRNMADGIDRIGTHPEAFETPAQKELRQTRRRQELATSASAEALAAAESATPPQSLAEVESMGTALLPGDAQRARAELGVGRNVSRFTGAREIAIAQGDTLANLAARYLGDARLWQHIAAVNGLKPPFVNEQAAVNLDKGDESPLPGAAGVGQKLLVPNFAKPPQAQPLLPVLGVRQDEPAEVHLLGSDLALEPVPGARGLYDIPIDIERGATDAKTVRGVANLRQAVVTRLAIERGTDTLYKRMGMQRVVGLSIAAIDLETARFRVSEAVGQDPRIAAVRRVELASTNDLLEVDLDAEVRGFTQSTNVKVAV